MRRASSCSPHCCKNIELLMVDATFGSLEIRLGASLFVFLLRVIPIANRGVLVSFILAFMRCIFICGFSCRYTGIPLFRYTVPLHPAWLPSRSPHLVVSRSRLSFISRVVSCARDIYEREDYVPDKERKLRSTITSKPWKK